MTRCRGAVLATCATALVLLWAVGAAAQQQARNDIWTYQYQGVGISDEHDKAFSAFMSMLHDRMVTLAGELSILDDQLIYLNGLSQHVVTGLDGQPLQFSGNPNNLQERWGNEGTLALLYGLIRKPTARVILPFSASPLYFL